MKTADLQQERNTRAVLRESPMWGCVANTYSVRDLSSTEIYVKIAVGHARDLVQLAEGLCVD